MVISTHETDLASFHGELRALVDQDCDVEAAQRLAVRLTDPAGIEALIPVALEMARLSPQPAARMIVGRALARLRPAHASTWRQVADIAASAGDFRVQAEALTHAAAAVDGHDGDRLGAAFAAYLDNDLGRAETLYGAVASQADGECGLALIALARGARELALRLVRRALARDAGHLEALRLKSQLDPDPATLARLETITSDASEAPLRRSAAAFALAQACDRRDDAAGATRWAMLANDTAAAKAQPYDREAEERAADQLLALFDALPPGSEPRLIRPRPIVIVGLPRSGTSLLESLLAAHPGVQAGGERTDFALACCEIEVVLRAKGVEAARALFLRRRDALISELASRLSAAGIQSPIYVDKFPLNTPYAGLIARLLPEARILFIRRDPVETALSIWLHDFSPAYAYATDINALAHAVVLNDRLRDAWKARLGAQFMEVDHDALCASPSAIGRRVFEFCGLAWGDAYLDPTNRLSNSNTFSALQVREPIRPRKPRAPLYAAAIGPLMERVRRG